MNISSSNHEFTSQNNGVVADHRNISQWNPNSHGKSGSQLTLFCREAEVKWRHCEKGPWERWKVGGVKPLRERWEKGGMTSRSGGRVWGWSVIKERVEEKWGKATKAEQRSSTIHRRHNFWKKWWDNFLLFSRKFNHFPVALWGIAVRDERHVCSVATAAPIFTLACSSLWKSEMWLRIRIRSVIEGRTKTTVTPSPLTECILL